MPVDLETFRYNRGASLAAITTLDGRYRKDILPLAPIVSEFGLIQARVDVEARHLIGLSTLGIVRSLDDNQVDALVNLAPNLSFETAERIKEVEDILRHDVRAMVKVFKEIFAGTSLEDVTDLTHLFITSEDINNIAYRTMLLRARDEVVIPQMRSFTQHLAEAAESDQDTEMLARTHGQAALGSTLGKEWVVDAKRFDLQTDKIASLALTGKFNGAVGNYNAHYLVAPHINWPRYSEDFVKSFGLVPNLYTTQINPYDDMIEMFQAFHRYAGIGIGFDQNMWRYVSDDWLTQKPVPTEDGSSTMVGKVNPIYLERSEGNFQTAQWIWEGLSRNLTQSRLQRDLSDSTKIRNMGLALGFQLLGVINMQEGFGRLNSNSELMQSRLDSDYSILGEAAQTLMQLKKFPNAYDLMKGLTRGLKLSREDWLKTVNILPMDSETRLVLQKLTPSTYLGIASQLTKLAVAEILDK